jgi:hypothetical protein
MLAASSFKGDFQYTNLHGVAYVAKATPIALLYFSVTAETLFKICLPQSQQLRAVAMLVLVVLRNTINRCIYIHNYRAAYQYCPQT